MVDYNNFAKTFSDSRINMKWAEMDYFLDQLNFSCDTKILDVGCGNGRFLGELKARFIDLKSDQYLGVDLSKGLLSEAIKFYPGFQLQELNMLELEKLNTLPFVGKGVPEGGGIIKKFSHIFFYASFHHLSNIQDRLTVLKQAYDLLDSGGTIYMTNWALSSEVNDEKYHENIIEGSENEFGSLDYNVKFSEFDRYYHCFSLDELEYLFTETGFQIIENRLFENKKNFVSIIKK